MFHRDAGSNYFAMFDASSGPLTPCPSEHMPLSRQSGPAAPRSACPLPHKLPATLQASRIDGASNREWSSRLHFNKRRYSPKSHGSKASPKLHQNPLTSLASTSCECASGTRTGDYPLSVPLVVAVFVSPPAHTRSPQSLGVQAGALTTERP